MPVILEIRDIVVRLFAYLCGIGALAIIAAEIFQSAPETMVVGQPAAPEWISVEQPAPAFMVNLPEFGAEPRYEIRRHLEGGGRKDILTFGEPGQTLRFVRMEIYRPGSELDLFPDPARDIAAQADDLVRAGEMQLSLPMDSKFGPAATVDFAVGHFGGGHCIGFVRSFETPRLRIAGLSCDMETIVDREDVACALDRLTLLSSGNDRSVAQIFARAEVNRRFCGYREPLMYATPRRPAPSPIVNLSAVRLRGALAR